MLNAHEPLTGESNAGQSDGDLRRMRMNSPAAEAQNESEKQYQEIVRQSRPDDSTSEPEAETKNESEQVGGRGRSQYRHSGEVCNFREDLARLHFA